MISDEWRVARQEQHLDLAMTDSSPITTTSVATLGRQFDRFLVAEDADGVLQLLDLERFL